MDDSKARRSLLRASVPANDGPAARLSDRERRILRAIAETAMPAGRMLPGPDDASIARIERLLSVQHPAALGAMRAMLWSIELSTMARTARTFTGLAPQKRLALLEDWYANDSFIGRAALRALLTPLKAAHYDTREMHTLVGAPFAVEAPTNVEPAPWLSNANDGAAITTDDTIECDVVIVGSGAGGAALAAELAARGHAVVIVESGRFFRRQDFSGRPTSMTHAMYLDRGMTLALGNVGMPVWAGRTVGGSTTINSGTCYRTPRRVLERWRRELGLSALTDDALGPWFEQVENVLGVERAPREHLGAVAAVIARGAEKLGYSHRALDRNAPGCDGQGLCCFGCPTGAKTSADVSWIPKALGRGAALFYSTHVDSVDGDTSKGRATGVTARTAGGAKLVFRARATVVACGALMTPVLLSRSGLIKNRWLGQNLSVHPAGMAMALMDERQDQWRGIPQSYAIDALAHEGIMFEGGSLPFSLAAVSLPMLGPRYVELVERYPYLATFGFMIEDTSRGRVRARPSGKGPVITYELNAHDAKRMHRAMGILADVFLEGGARLVLPGIRGLDQIRDRRDLERFRRTPLAASRLELTAYHPLGTARMARRPEDGVVGPDHESHEVRDLYVVDGAAVPTALGVNPQVTIMALALRAADLVDRRLTMRGTG